MKTSKLFVLLFLLATTISQAQFTKLSTYFPLSNTVIKSSDNTTYLFSYAYDAIIKARLNSNNNTLESVTFTVPQNSTVQEINALNVINPDVLLVRIIELNNSTNVLANHIYLTADGAKNWIKMIAPDNYLPSFSYSDEQAGIIYFNKTDNSGYFTYNYNTNVWDSIEFKDYAFDIIKMTDGVGYLQLLANGSDKIGYTTDGGKTFQVLNNIDYSKQPFTWANNGILQKMIMVTNEHWYDQYHYEVSGEQVSKLMTTTDKGSTWKNVMSTNVDIIQPASNNSVYVYKQNGPTGILYLVSDFGNKICPTTFTGRVQNMNYWDAKNGLIFASDSTNSQYGLWVVSNAGGANCFASAQGVKPTTTKKSTTGMSVYPNPAVSQLSISNFELTGNSTYSIQSLTGQVLLDGTIAKSQTELEINVSSLSSGVYVVRIGDSVSKFVKQ